MSSGRPSDRDRSRARIRYGLRDGPGSPAGDGISAGRLSPRRLGRGSGRRTGGVRSSLACLAEAPRTRSLPCLVQPDPGQRLPHAIAPAEQAPNGRRDDANLESGDPFRAALARDAVGRACRHSAGSCAWSSCFATGGSFRWPKSPTPSHSDRHRQIETPRRAACAAPPDRAGGRGLAMNDSELDDGLDVEMDQRLTRLARSSREPPCRMR